MLKLKTSNDLSEEQIAIKENISQEIRKDDFNFKAIISNNGSEDNLTINSLANVSSEIMEAESEKEPILFPLKEPEIEIVNTEEVLETAAQAIELHAVVLEDNHEDIISDFNEPLAKEKTEQPFNFSFNFSEPKMEVIKETEIVENIEIEPTFINETEVISTIELEEEIIEPEIKEELPIHVTLVAVSKTNPIERIEEAYAVGQRHFGENKVQEMVAKASQLPKDIFWHLIGHLQTNKVKYIAPFVHLIHAVDSFKLLQEIDKHAKINNRMIDCLLQVYIAKEDTKFGFSIEELDVLLREGKYKELTNTNIRGLMGMATNTHNTNQIAIEFDTINKVYTQIKKANLFQQFDILSIGMSSDYPIAVEHGSNMVRVGSNIFGERKY
jgi:pyridoxal phosphate enzyme (YggS family)